MYCSVVEISAITGTRRLEIQIPEWADPCRETEAENNLILVKYLSAYLPGI